MFGVDRKGNYGPLSLHDYSDDDSDDGNDFVSDQIRNQRVSLLERRADELLRLRANCGLALGCMVRPMCGLGTVCPIDVWQNEAPNGGKGMVHQ